MANTYFCFSDECGDYKPNMNANQLRIHPYYIRATLIINSNEWKSLNNKFKVLKNKYGLPITKELKWSNLWALRNFQKNNKPIPNNHEIKYLENVEYNSLIDFVDETLGLVNGLHEKKIIATFTKNTCDCKTNEKSMLSFHLQEHMQRVEMELQEDKGNLAVIFFDPVSNAKNELFRQIYNDLFENGDFVEDYKSIKDSLNIENSHHSVGIQITDFISGAFSSILKASSSINYSKGVKMFFEHVYPNLRRSRDGVIEGYGIREVPKNPSTRKWFIEHLNTIHK